MNPNDLKWIHVRQHFDAPRAQDAYSETLHEIERLGAHFAPGERIAIAVGSRGIANLAQVVRATVDAVKCAGAQPFIIPAMGSHGNATPEGQESVLASYGVTQERMGAPVVSSMQVVDLGQVADHFHAYMSTDAFHADGVIAINRVKPHTDFHGPVESGLMKMLVIGLGKHSQALAAHSHGVYGLRELIPLAAKAVLETGKIRLGIGLVENAYDQTMCIRAALPADIPALDSELLALARRNMPSLPVDQLDVLLVDEIGKDISGTCLDTSIIGRISINGQDDPPSPKISCIVALSLTPASHGNATGMGLCDIVTEAFKGSVDFQATYENVATSSFLRRGMMPMVARDEHQAMSWALRSVGIRTPESARAIRIRSTLHVSELWLTPAVLSELQGGPLWQERRMEIIE